MSQANRQQFENVNLANAGVDATGEKLGPIRSNKVFVAPFRMAFQKKDEDAIVWIEVRSLEGLRAVAKRLDKDGDLEEIDRFTTMEMQLWGHVAEHTGFMRSPASPSALAAGIQPLGPEAASLAEDFSALMGGNEIDGLNVLTAMKETLTRRPIDLTPMPEIEVTHEFIKEDGVNLTEKGEDALRELVLGKEDPASKEFAKATENAIQIFRETPEPTEEEREQEVREAIDCEIAHETGNTEGGIKTGREVTHAGRLVADAYRGLDNEADKAVQAEAEEAIKILEKMMATVEKREDGADLLARYNTTMEELHRLATSAKPHDPHVPSANSPAETDRLNRENLRKIMKNVNELTLAIMVGESEPTIDLPSEDDPVDERHGADHYRPRGRKSNDDEAQN